jgi:putative membrane protein
MMWWNGGMHWWGYAFMAFGTLLFWGLVIAAIVALVRYVGRGGQPVQAPPTTPPTTPPTAEEILAGRYARGEIDDAEYQERLHTLIAARGA